jgi:hypothetical protein
VQPPFRLLFAKAVLGAEGSEGIIPGIHLSYKLRYPMQATRYDGSGIRMIAELGHGRIDDDRISPGQCMVFGERPIVQLAPANDVVLVPCRFHERAHRFGNIN